MSKYWLRDLSPIDYNSVKIVGSDPPIRRRRRPTCDQCFRRNSQDIHLKLEDKSDSDIDLVFKGISSAPGQTQRRILVNVYEALVRDTTLMAYNRNVCKQDIRF